MKQLHQFKVYFYDIDGNILAVETFHNVSGRQDFFTRLAGRKDCLGSYDEGIWIDGEYRQDVKSEFYASIA